MKYYQKIVAFVVMLFVMAYVTPLMAASSEKGGVEGRVVMADGSPPVNAAVVFFSNNIGPLQLPQPYDWQPDAAAPVIGGHFSTQLLPGNYWYGVIRIPDRRIGGHFRDWLYISNKKDGTINKVEIKKDQKSRMGEILIQDDMFAGRQRDPISLVRGHLDDQFKSPVAGFVIEAFTSNEDGARPVFSSDPTDENGLYLIRLTAGVFYLKIRPVERINNRGQFDQNYGKYVLPGAFRFVAKEDQEVPGVDLVARLKAAPR
jgi:hypothetical protein